MGSVRPVSLYLHEYPLTHLQSLRGQRGTPSGSPVYALERRTHDAHIRMPHSLSEATGAESGGRLGATSILPDTRTSSPCVPLELGTEGQRAGQSLARWLAPLTFTDWSAARVTAELTRAVVAWASPTAGGSGERCPVWPNFPEPIRIGPVIWTWCANGSTARRSPSRSTRPRNRGPPVSFWSRPTPAWSLCGCTGESRRPGPCRNRWP
jgi:hypothetical protein